MPVQPDEVRGNRVVVSGQPSDWDAAAEAVKDMGGVVLAFHDPFLTHKEAKRGEVPVLLGEQLRTVEDALVVYGTRPRYRWFTASPPAPQRCMWLVPPNRWQLRGNHQPDLWDRETELQEAFDSLGDDESRMTFGALLRARLDGDTGYYRVAGYREYQHALVSPRGDDIVIDGGAYDGMVSEMFARNLSSDGRVYALEPSPPVYTTMWRRVQEKRLSNLVPVCLGLWNRDDTLSFADEVNTTSRVSEKGGTLVPVVAIDSFVDRMRLPRLDALKLDTEGAEWEVLEGARETLRRFRPKLMISAYHKPNDFFELLLWIKRTIPNYVFYMGHHSYCNAETDIYALPKEKLVSERMRGVVNLVRKRVRKRANEWVFHSRGPMHSDD